MKAKIHSFGYIISIQRIAEYNQYINRQRKILSILYSIGIKRGALVRRINTKIENAERQIEVTNDVIDFLNK